MRVTLKTWEWPGDEASTYLQYIAMLIIIPEAAC